MTSGGVFCLRNLLILPEIMFCETYNYIYTVLAPLCGILPLPHSCFHTILWRHSISLATLQSNTYIEQRPFSCLDKQLWKSALFLWFILHQHKQDDNLFSMKEACFHLLGHPLDWLSHVPAICLFFFFSMELATYFNIVSQYIWSKVNMKLEGLPYS